MATFLPAHLIDAVVILITAAAYFMVGQLTLKREMTTSEARLANTLFAVWWLALGVQTFTRGLLSAYASFDTPSLAAFVTNAYLTSILLAVALWGLLYYLAYLYTGRKGILTPLSYLYGGVALLFMYTVAWMNPIAVERTETTLRVVYANPIGGPAILAIVGVLVVPTLVATIAYGSLFFRVTTAEQKYRVGLVSGAFFAWFGWALLSTLVNLLVGTNLEAFALVSKLFGLLVPLLIMMAYRPPRFIRERLQATPNPG